MSAIFNNMKDNDFYTDKLAHLYLDGEITSIKIDKLIEDIRDANKAPNTKPILIHISSTGGSLEDGMRLINIYNISKLPIATIVDNYCFSIATLLLINSPYRLMTKNSYCLLHEYRVHGYMNSERQQIYDIIKKLDNYFDIIIDMYIKKTKFSKNELIPLLKHNLILNYKTCLKKGIVDRIINNSYKHKSTKIDILKYIQDTSINNLHLSCSTELETIDNIINDINTKNKKPCLVYITHFNCDKDENEHTPKNAEITNSIITIFKPLCLVSRIKNIKTNTYGIIDTPISIENLIPLLYTDKIYMYSNTFIICNLINSFNNYSLLLDDNIKNTNLIVDNIKSILKTKTKMKTTDIDNINKKFIILNAKKSKELGLCHEIIY